MQNQALFISVCLGIVIFLVIVLLAILQYQKSNQNSRYGKEHPEDWLFHDFYLKVYGAVFGNLDPDEAAMKLGINIEKYHKSCLLTRTKPNVKKLVANHIYGFLVLLTSILFILFASPIFALVGAVLFFYLVYYEQQTLDRKADEMRLQVAVELPRFLDLLQTELMVGLPIENAIFIICEKFDSLLSREFLESLNEMELGVSGWQQALEKVAQKYSVETLSNFVLDVSTAYSKGVSITDSVVRKTKEIKETHLLTIKERAGKAQNALIIQVAVFQIVPMLIYIMLPVIITIADF